MSIHLLSTRETCWSPLFVLPVPRKTTGRSHRSKFRSVTPAALKKFRKGKTQVSPKWGMAEYSTLTDVATSRATKARLTACSIYQKRTLTKRPKSRSSARNFLVGMGKVLGQERKGHLVAHGIRFCVHAHESDMGSTTIASRKTLSLHWMPFISHLQPFCDFVNNLHYQARQPEDFWIARNAWKELSNLILVPVQCLAPQQRPQSSRVLEHAVGCMFEEVFYTIVSDFSPGPILHRPGQTVSDVFIKRKSVDAGHVRPIALVSIPAVAPLSSFTLSLLTSLLLTASPG